MNNDIICNDPRKHGTVTGFARFSSAMLNSMRADVGLAMSAQQLEILRTYYSRTARRDPTLDELYMLDRLISLRGPGGSPLARLSTDSSTIADTYADLMAKRGALNIIRSQPSLQELLVIPAHYMERVGKSTPDAEKYLFAAGPEARIQLLLNGCTDILYTGDGAVGKICRQSKYTPGSLLALLPRTPDLTQEQFEERLSALLSSPAASCVDAGAVVDESGLIDTVCKFGTGAYMDAAALPIKQPCAPEAFCDACHGWVLAVLSHAGYTEFAAAARELSIPCIVIGSLASGNKLTLKHEKFNNAVFDMDFISTVAPCSQLQLQPQMAEDSTPADSVARFAYDGSLMLVTHVAPLDTTPYQTAMAAVLRAVSDCVARGAAYSDVCISVKLTLPRNTADAALEALLGVYRAQIEYYIPDRDSELVFDDNTAPAITVAAMTRLPQTAPADTESLPKYLYLMSPRTGENGLPCFEELRRMWGYVAEEVRGGRVISATALTSAYVPTDIDKLICDGTVLDNATPNGQMPRGAGGSILLLAPRPMQGTFIGAITAESGAV